MFIIRLQDRDNHNHPDPDCVSGPYKNILKRHTENENKYPTTYTHIYLFLSNNICYNRLTSPSLKINQFPINGLK